VGLGHGGALEGADHAAVGDDQLQANASYRMTSAHAVPVVGCGDPGHGGGRPAQPVGQRALTPAAQPVGSLAQPTRPRGPGFAPLEPLGGLLCSSPQMAIGTAIATTAIRPAWQLSPLPPIAFSSAVLRWTPLVPQ
jgi:hypothetical protein